MDRVGAALTPAHNRVPGRWIVAVAALPVLFLAAFFVAPLVVLVAETARWSAWSDAWSTPGLVSAVRYTAVQAALSTLLALVIGVVPAYVVGRYSFAGRRLVQALVVVPFVLPAVAVGAGWLALLPEHWQGTPGAVVAAHAWVNLAVVVRVVSPAWEQVGIDRTAAARTLGAGQLAVARWVVWPTLRPAVARATVIIAALCVTSFGIASILGGPAHPTVEMEVVRRAVQQGDVARAAPLAVAQLVILGVIAVAVLRGGGRTATSGAGTAQRRPRLRSERLLVVASSVALCIAVVVPIAALVVRSMRVGGAWSLRGWSFGAVVNDRGLSTGIATGASLRTSLAVAAVAALLAVIVGACAALAVDRAARADGRWARAASRGLLAGSVAPLAISAVLAGLGIIITFDRAPIDWRRSWWMVPICHAVMATPFVVAVCTPALRSAPAAWFASAATLGASPLRAWAEIQGGRLRRQLPGAAAVAAVISLGDVGASSLLTRSGQPTAPVAIASALSRAGDLPRAQGLATAAMLAAMCAAAALLVGRRPAAAP